jgi:hypothetical protein
VSTSTVLTTLGRSRNLVSFACVSVPDKIDESIRIHDRLLIILSENSIQSPWVAAEVESAFEREHSQNDQPVLFPIRLDDGVMHTDQPWAARIRQRRHIGDVRNWKDHDSPPAVPRVAREKRSATQEPMKSLAFKRNLNQIYLVFVIFATRLRQMPKP